MLGHLARPKLPEMDAGLRLQKQIQLPPIGGLDVSELHMWNEELWNHT